MPLETSLKQIYPTYDVRLCWLLCQRIIICDRAMSLEWSPKGKAHLWSSLHFNASKSTWLYFIFLYGSKIVGHIVNKLYAKIGGVGNLGNIKLPTKFKKNDVNHQFQTLPKPERSYLPALTDNETSAQIKCNKSLLFFGVACFSWHVRHAQ